MDEEIRLHEEVLKSCEDIIFVIDERREQLERLEQQHQEVLAKREEFLRHVVKTANEAKLLAQKETLLHALETSQSAIDDHYEDMVTAESEEPRAEAQTKLEREKRVVETLERSIVVLDRKIETGEVEDACSEDPALSLVKQVDLGIEQLGDDPEIDIYQYLTQCQRALREILAKMAREVDDLVPEPSRLVTGHTPGSVPETQRYNVPLSELEEDLNRFFKDPAGTDESDEDAESLVAVDGAGAMQHEEVTKSGKARNTLEKIRQQISQLIRSPKKNAASSGEAKEAKEVNYRRYVVDQQGASIDHREKNKQEQYTTDEGLIKRTTNEHQFYFNEANKEKAHGNASTDDSGYSTDQKESKNK